MLPAAFSVFFVIIAVIWLTAIGSFALGIAALISVGTTPTEAFGPWWDNTRQTWLVGIAISFLIPFGHLITGLMWFTSGRPRPQRGQTFAGRPFWAGPPRPQPLMPPPGWPGYGPPQYGAPPPPPPPPPSPATPGL